MKKLLLLAIASTFSAGAWADCSSAKTVFQCTTANNKMIQVCDSDKNITYSFGKHGSPELSVSNPRNKVKTYQWDGFGRNENYAVIIPNGSTFYRVFERVDKSKQSSLYGVEVSKNDQLLATVNCSQSKKIISNIEGINLNPE